MPHTLVNRDALDELAAVIGPDKLTRILDRFLLCLATAFEGTERGADDYGREAHTLVSMAGMLGCDAFSRACRDLEATAQAGDDLTDRLADVGHLRDRTLAALKGLKAVVEADPGQLTVTASSGASKIRTAPSGG